MIIAWLVATGLGVTLIVVSVLEHGDAARSSYTQAHGVRRAATVISEDTGTGKNPDTALAVRLTSPVSGHGTTTAHIKGAPAYSPGAPVTVVVDPQDPGYAELPGAPYKTSFSWEFPLGEGLVAILLVPFIAGYQVLRRSRSRRRLRRSLLR